MEAGGSSKAEDAFMQQVFKERRNSLPYPVGEDYCPPFPCEIVGTYSNHGIEPGHAHTVVKRNQDRGSVEWPFAGNPHTVLFGVFDGHGEDGAAAAEFSMVHVYDGLMRDLPSALATDPSLCIKEKFKEVDAKMRVDRSLDTAQSGTTALVMLFEDGGKGRGCLTLAHAGDTRAVIGKRSAGGISAEQLTQDHKPTLAKERKRIERAGGIVKESGEDDVFSASVWLPDQTRGLAMSRSIGDQDFHRIGVSAEPEVSIRQVGDYDEFVIIASDGIWEMMTNEQAVLIVKKHKDATEACTELIRTATAEWSREEGVYRDDITAIVVFLAPLRGFIRSQAGPPDVPSPRFKTRVDPRVVEQLSGMSLGGAEGGAKKEDGPPEMAPAPGPNWIRRMSMPSACFPMAPQMGRGGVVKGRRASFSMSPDMDQDGGQLSPGSPPEKDPIRVDEKL